MIPVEEARARIVGAFEPLPHEMVALADAHGRVLAADQAARITQPWAAVSAMDGYAVRGAEVAALPATLTMVGAVAAGGRYDGVLQPGECVRIFTGAPLPEGADTVVLQEDVRADGPRIAVLEATPGRHVRVAGLDFRAGDVGLEAGRRLTARDIGLAAAMNLPWLPVRRRPRVALLATGDELVLPGEPIGRSQIVSSNSLAIAALVRAAGGEAIDLGIAADRPEALAEAAAGAAGADLLVTIGGASVGDHDLVRNVLADRGMSLDFWSIAMRPGKPLMFGRSGRMRLLGLPGNPVSATVCSLIFLRPALRRLLGLPDRAETVQAPLARDLGANDRRQDYLRSALVADESGTLRADPFRIQDSSMLSLLARADCLVVRPPHAPAARAGDLVSILPFSEADAGL